MYIVLARFAGNKGEHMVKTQTESKHHFAIFPLLGKITGMITGAGPILELIEIFMAKQAEKMLRRILGLMVVYSAMLAGIVILVIGGVMVIIDYAAIPRGIAFSLGGLLLILVSALWMQLSKK
jgi:hypothetical protein